MLCILSQQTTPILLYKYIIINKPLCLDMMDATYGSIPNRDSDGNDSDGNHHHLSPPPPRIDWSSFLFGKHISESSPSTTTGNNSNHSAAFLLRQWGFLTGCLYCVIIVCGFAAELGVRGTMIDYEDSAATAALIRANPVRLRRGLLLDVTMSCADIFVSVLLAFILLLAGASPILTIASSVFRLLQQAVIAANLLHMFAASLLLDKSLHPTMPVSSIMDSLSIDGSTSAGGGAGDAANDVSADLAFFFLYLHKYGYLLALIFFGISMLLLGIIILKHGIFPHWMGWAISLAGVGYIMDSLLYFMLGSYNGKATSVLMLPVLVAEFALAGFLVLRSPQKAAG